MLLYWLSNSRAGTVVLAFEDTTLPSEENNKTGEKPKLGKAIADSLVGELHRIRHIHTCLTQAMRTGEEDIQLQRLGEFNFPPLTPIQENIESNLTEVGTFEVGKTSISIGRILLVLKWLWPFGGVKRVISGSVQTYASTIRLFVRLEYLNQVKAWEVTWKNDQTQPMTEKVRDLAYKVVMGLVPDITAQTWEGFKFFTEAIHNYYLYQHTGLLEDLQNAEENCKKARQVEKNIISLRIYSIRLALPILKIKNMIRQKKLF
ncbi:hypothetical protein QUB80_06705 [Chlorogloeopsis sp. ULAP01]|uniref:hypothetical protein n=1 Tax=Chlorogloeopsis sp. ULAP01 TaxID=3056483 RepID=UPI0025AA4935|nr:hypothetical protein [Chlorogloeopsis sp. ULAP01]MDM9380391.1 hypothetical protein [Chlorogloeopsis sp. ULAP01]